MAFVSALVGNVLTTWVSTFSIAVIMWSIERLLPKGRVSIESQIRSLKFWVFAGLGTALALTIYGYVSQWLNPQPFLVLPLNSWLASPWLHWSAYLLAPLLGMILYDFFGYWLHRAQHKWFWRFHAIHHSIEELSGINSYFHWSEQFFRIGFISLPAAQLLGIDGLESVFVVELLLKLQGYYLHSPNSIHFGPIVRRVIADNRFHRMHHSVEQKHWDKNFGAGTSIWDQLFGTAYFPTEDEWPATGVVGRPETRSSLEFIWGPFRPARSELAAPQQTYEAQPRELQAPAYMQIRIEAV